MESNTSWLWTSDVPFNTIDIVLTRDRLGEGVVNVNIPKHDFERMMKRAASHSGYTATQKDIYECHFADGTVLNYDEGSSRMWALRKELKDYVCDSQLMMRKLMITKVPMSELSCSEQVVSRKFVRRLYLRVHKFAKLVFSVSLAKGVDQEQIRTVYLEIDARVLCDGLKRTVQNTVQVVLLGLTPRIAARSTRSVINGAIKREQRLQSNSVH